MFFSRSVAEKKKIISDPASSSDTSKFVELIADYVHVIALPAGRIVDYAALVKSKAKQGPDDVVHTADEEKEASLATQTADQQQAMGSLLAGLSLFLSKENRLFRVGTSARIFSILTRSQYLVALSWPNETSQQVMQISPRLRFFVELCLLRTPDLLAVEFLRKVIAESNASAEKEAVSYTAQSYAAPNVATSGKGSSGAGSDTKRDYLKPLFEHKISSTIRQDLDGLASVLAPGYGEISWFSRGFQDSEDTLTLKAEVEQVNKRSQESADGAGSTGVGVPESGMKGGGENPKPSRLFGFVTRALLDPELSKKLADASASLLHLDSPATGDKKDEEHEPTLETHGGNIPPAPLVSVFRWRQKSIVSSISRGSSEDHTKSGPWVVMLHCPRTHLVLLADDVVSDGSAAGEYDAKSNPDKITFATTSVTGAGGEVAHLEVVKAMLPIVPENCWLSRSLSLFQRLCGFGVDGCDEDTVVKRDCLDRDVVGVKDKNRGQEEATSTHAEKTASASPLVDYNRGQQEATSTYAEKTASASPIVDPIVDYPSSRKTDDETSTILKAENEDLPVPDNEDTTKKTSRSRRVQQPHGRDESDDKENDPNRNTASTIGGSAYNAKNGVEHATAGPATRGKSTTDKKISELVSGGDALDQMLADLGSSSTYRINFPSKTTRKVDLQQQVRDPQGQAFSRGIYGQKPDARPKADNAVSSATLKKHSLVVSSAPEVKQTAMSSAPPPTDDTVSSASARVNLNNFQAQPPSSTPIMNPNPSPVLNAKGPRPPSPVLKAKFEFPPSFSNHLSNFQPQTAASLVSIRARPGDNFPRRLVDASTDQQRGRSPLPKLPVNMGTKPDKNQDAPSWIPQSRQTGEGSRDKQENVQLDEETSAFGPSSQPLVPRPPSHPRSLSSGPVRRPRRFVVQ
ncbi:unnamed protein product [Amoebophrya sp. A25]|nr:unnamed protein product [Amoebophrya sp. A25]|eukprot:GSA25T00006596001.1